MCPWARTAASDGQRRRLPRFACALRDLEAEACSSTLGVLHPDSPAVELDNAARDVQAETGGSGARARLLETLEDHFSQLRRDARTAVDDGASDDTFAGRNL